MALTLAYVHEVSTMHTITTSSDQSRYTTWWSMPSYPDCRAKPVSADTPPWCRASWRRSGLSAHSRRVPFRWVADGGGPKTSFSHRLTIAGQRGVVRSRDRDVDWVGRVCTLPGLVGRRPGLDLEASAHLPGRSGVDPPQEVAKHLQSLPHGATCRFVQITRRRTEWWMAARTPSSWGRTSRCTRNRRVGRQTQLELQSRTGGTLRGSCSFTSSEPN